ncbi:PP2C family protein-serine/threonine phosphatase [Leptospira sp. GIMC2001]|uniref:PP2C family protein-serine/threonine phosphatase n=1 Tax=Leptospira sp. GIMC2001 TaxID=1513297 RepID=UPI00234A4A8B|nr:SpoIIE family protein phosphatase [Leptospira sp. GIMC2001]WCL49005.1 SpoIIE family protein phosphatase [Leptospira sp. GIMC2001]
MVFGQLIKIKKKTSDFIFYFILFNSLLTIPISIFALFLFSNYHTTLVENSQELLLAKAKAVAASLENSIKDRVYPSNKAKEFINVKIQPQGKIFNQQTFQLIRNNDRIEFEYLRENNSQLEIWRFNGEFLVDKLLDSEHITNQETVFVQNQFNTVGISSLIEEDFQISPNWQKIILTADTFGLMSLFSKESKGFFVVSSKMPTLPFNVILLRSRNDISNSVLQGLIKLALSFLLIITLVSTISFFFAKNIDNTRSEQRKLYSFVNNLPIGAILVDKELNPLISNIIIESIQRDEKDFWNQVIREAQFRIQNSKSNILKQVWEIQNEKTWEITLSPWYGDLDIAEGYSFILRDLTAKKIMFEHEMQMAKAIQEEYLPNDEETFEGLSFKVYYKPYYQVGGDYYDFIQLDRNRYLFVMADVIGHGLQAAMMMTVVKVLFLQITATHNDPKDILIQLSHSIKTSLPPGKAIVPLHFLIIDTSSKVIEYANAGHPGLIYQEFSNPELLESYDTLNPVIGFMPFTNPKIVSFKYESKSRFFLYTDGLMDVRNSHFESFSINRIEKFLKENCHLNPEVLSKELENELINFADGEKFPDDITWFVIDTE